MGLAGDDHDARRGALAEPVEEQRREQERADVVRPEVQLEAARGHAALPGQPGVVDQPVERLARREERLSARADGVEVAEVEYERCHARARGGGDVGDRGAQLLRRAPSHEHVRAALREPQRRLPPDPGVRPVTR